MNFLLSSFIVASFVCDKEKRERPAKWACKIISERLRNLYRVDDKLYRSEQPGSKAMKEIERLGIKTVLNLRNWHSDKTEIKNTALNAFQIAMNAGKITEEHIVKSLKVIKESEHPVLVHCWHGADRTGTICAAYRIVFNGWSIEEALEELTRGGYGYHAIYKNIPETLRTIDWKRVRDEIFQQDKNDNWFQKHYKKFADDIKNVAHEITHKK